MLVLISCYNYFSTPTINNFMMMMIMEYLDMIMEDVINLLYSELDLVIYVFQVLILILFVNLNSPNEKTNSFCLHKTGF